MKNATFRSDFRNRKTTEPCIDRIRGEFVHPTRIRITTIPNPEWMSLWTSRIHRWKACARRLVWWESVFVSSGVRSRLYTYYIEKTINYPWYRWIVLVLCIALFIRRIVHANGYFLIAYSLGLYLLNLLLGFLSPLVKWRGFQVTNRTPMTTIRPSFPRATQQSIVPLFVVFLNSSSGAGLCSQFME